MFLKTEPKLSEIDLLLLVIFFLLYILKFQRLELKFPIQIGKENIGYSINEYMSLEMLIKIFLDTKLQLLLKKKRIW